MKTRAALGVPHIRPVQKRRGARASKWG
jgi:hypothetical protein